MALGTFLLQMFFFRDCSVAVCDEELILGMIDAPFKPGIMKVDLFSGQVRLLTYDVITKSP